MEFAVTGLRIRPFGMAEIPLDREKPMAAKPSGKVTLAFENSCGDTPGPVYVFRVSNSGEMGRFRPEEWGDGKVTIELPSSEGEYFAVQTSENRYGEYSSNKLFFRVSE